jgi:hypothetical protein
MLVGVRTGAIGFSLPLFIDPRACFLQTEFVSCLLASKFFANGPRTHKLRPRRI